jgi:hypothetical protein
MPPVTLRRVRPTERRVLQTKLRTSTLPVRLYQRYRIVAEAARGRTVPEIVERVGCHEQTAYLWLHRFNGSGFETFERATNSHHVGAPPEMFPLDFNRHRKPCPRKRLQTRDDFFGYPSSIATDAHRVKMHGTVKTRGPRRWDRVVLSLRNRGLVQSEHFKRETRRDHPGPQRCRAFAHHPDDGEVFECNGVANRRSRSVRSLITGSPRAPERARRPRAGRASP